MTYENPAPGIPPYSAAVPHPVLPNPGPAPQKLPPAAASVEDLDLLPRVKGLYRLLDLYSENATGGLVDKIIISQESLKNFLEAVRPGSYESVTKIDFHALDLLSINAVGIYGSKTEIVRFLRNTGAVDDEVGQRLLVPYDTTITIQPHLRSGIYAFIPSNAQYPDGSFNPHAAIYTIYWPEETTWDDDAIGAVRKNRVTFMRYLTRLTDQIRALISPEHSSALVWKVESESNDFDDRFFKFEVAKTDEQVEDAAIRDGFKVSHQAITTNLATSSLPDGTSSSLSLDATLVHCETRQAFADRKYLPAQTQEKRIDLKYSSHHLRAMLRDHDNIHFADTVDYKGLEILLEDGGLKDRVPELYRKYTTAIRKMESSQRSWEADEARQALAEVIANRTRLRSSVREYVRGRLAGIFPTLSFDDDTVDLAPGQSLDAGTDEYLHNLRGLYPAVDEAVKNTFKDKDDTFRVIKASQYKTMKERYFTLQNELKKHGRMSEPERNEAIATLVSDSDATSLTPHTSTWRTYVHTVLSKIGSSISYDNSTSRQTKRDEDDPESVSRLAHLATQDRAYAPIADKVFDLVSTSLREKIASVTDSLVKTIESAQEKAINEKSRHLSSARTSRETETLRSEYRRLFQEALIANSTQPPLVISSVAKSRPSSHSIEVLGLYQHQTEAKILHRLWALETPEYDLLRLSEDHKYQPKPQILSHPVATCSLPLTWNLRYMQILNSRSRKHILLVIDLLDSVGIWLFPLLDGVSLDRPTKSIPNMKNRRYALACDEQRRLLAIVISDADKFICQPFVIDESFANIQSRGSPFDLLPWYEDGIPDITAAAFFADTEELCLIEENGRVRVFSFLAQGFKPGMIQLNPGICHVQASPDGTALVAIEQDQHGKRLRIFHMASFGHNETGISIVLPEEFDSATSFTLTSIGERRNVFLLALSPSLQSIHSVALDITCKETEYQFRAKAGKTQSTASTSTIHNALIDCFSEVWSRYPVVAAIQREMFAGSKRLPPSITFVSEDPQKPFEPYFKQMVCDFKQLSKKPTEKRLDSIVIETVRFEALEWDTPVTSTYRAGEWLAELLCLIPIHIALARDNHFVPLKDGILDPVLERQLLGAEVATIIDAITIGWYESIFSSYMATKPVKVVSSMGEQSVGKSYSLNHLVDSSFAGSAVRTTEGVWLSVCPTKDVLVVALDFEGVHSIERTAQEDMLLVLFNTALSNLVLFRNNFALSRDVANMFTSFQASTHLFNPASNPKLFKGLLAIVIKDVVDGDKNEIVKEFTSKFSRIVSIEKADNFITVLHDSQLTVIPWNVIQSREFYSLFSRLSYHLFEQETTHRTAGEFLITLKTLMAKLKAQDWGSIDHTVIKHRVGALTVILPNAFTTGHAEIEPAVDDLKNLDSQEPIVATDSEAVFYVGKDPQEVDQALSVHLQNWKPDAARHSVEDLQEHLKVMATLRLAHVQVWLEANTARFPVDNPDIRRLRRLFDDTSAALLANIQLCLAECERCRLRCMLSRSHDVSSERHDCQTSHNCEMLWLATRVVIYVKRVLTFVVNPVHLMPRGVANACAQNLLITKGTNTFVQPEDTNAECHAIYKTSLHRIARPTAVPVCAPSHTILATINIAVTIGFLALSSVSCVSATAHSAITFMASAAIRYTFVGHPQAEHDTAHGSMERTVWAIEGAEDVTIEIQGRKFGAQDNGAPQLCSSICRDLGRHAHIDYCRNAKWWCQEPESEHIKERMLPNPDRPKDWVSHKVFWARTGFRGRRFGFKSKPKLKLHVDPYSREEQAEFALCDVQCAGPEHDTGASASARPSYCTLPIFHPPQPTNWRVAGNTSHISADGHSFGCRNPNDLRQAYHVIFVLDKSGSMSCRDRHPLPNQPVTRLIMHNNDNRLGAVLSSLYGFWVSRGSVPTGGRRDAYSVITFDSETKIQFANDFTSDANQLLQRIVGITPDAGTDFDAALKTTQTVMENNWSTDRSPVVIFLSDGECDISDNVIYDLCNRAVARGKPLSFHSVAFGTVSKSLRRMVTLAEQVAQAAPRNPLSPLVPCSYTDVMDTIRLAEAFLQIADSLKKPRASLIRMQ
ncbi:hypothetical protein FRB99_003283 [Tulasnella sp. 403]|nr:hypothetical protein FRB99_003283 [Tulasnella sp. 403]